MKKVSQQKGQVLILLLLITLVALTIGLAITQRSVTDISNSTKTEQSSRAFSAAEAGIEKALQNPGATPGPVSFIENQSSSVVTPTDSLPRPGQTLEYPKIGKADFSHFWLADPNTLDTFFNPSALGIRKFSVFFGTSANDPEYNATDTAPAIEVHLVSEFSNTYVSKRAFFDSISTRNNGFTYSSANCPSSRIVGPVFTILSTSSTADRYFRCRYDVDLDALYGAANVPSHKLVLARIRVLYSNTSQPVAISSCNTSPSNSYTECDLPPQANILSSVGSSGETKRRLQLFRLYNVVPFYFDYAIFSTGEIEKT